MKLNPSPPLSASDTTQATAVPRSASPAVLHLQRILVPLDFSPCAFKALEYALALTRQFGAELFLVHVVEPYPPVPQMDPVDAESVRDARKQLELIRQSIGHATRCLTQVRTGEPHQEIIQTAKDHRIDLIVIATHGRKGLAHALLGSTTDKVSRLAPCPVLIVRENERDFVAPFVTAAEASVKPVVA